MASIAGEASYQERSLFVRKATGLVRGWSVHDAFIYATILTKEFFQPLGAILGWHGFVDFWGKPKGVFTSSVITAILAAIFISLGMRGYAKLQKICFYGGMLGLAIVFGLLLFHSKDAFISAFNTHAVETYHGKANADAATLKGGSYDGANNLGNIAFGS